MKIVKMNFRYGLKLCLDTGFKHVLCLSDLTTVVDFIQNDLNVHHKYRNLIMTIKHLLHRDWMFSLRHTLREDNTLVDFLTRKGALSNNSLVILNETPPRMASLLLSDVLGVVFVRP